MSSVRKLKNNYPGGVHWIPHGKTDITRKLCERVAELVDFPLVNCLGYLNPVQAGGGTFYPKLDIEIMPRLGRIVLFHNCYPDSTKRHDKSLHGGMPLDKGEKWACNFWFRENRFQTEPQQDPFRPSETTRRF